ncbi:MAG: hypothetical protein ACSHXF_04880 [Aquaticitalea sp.]
MKAVRIFMSICLLTALVSCSDDDDNSTQLSHTTTWNLTHVFGGFAGIDQTLPSGLVQWTFDSETDMLTVVNNNTDEMVVDFFDSGTYPYSIQNDGTNDLITIDGIDFGIYTETENEITIDQQVNDGFLLTLTK